jgi:RNA polymerase sigma-70 factor (ECF subfamily)
VELAGRLEAESSIRRSGRDEGHRGRSTPADLHLLPPGAAADAQVALTLREVCGLTTEEIARAFLTRAARRSRSASCAPRRRSATPHSLRGAGRPELPDRLDAVLQVIYLVFNEGYSASSGASLTRPDLSAEAIRLGRLLVELLPGARGSGLLGLMLLHESRRLLARRPPASSSC